MDTAKLTQAARNYYTHAMTQLADGRVKGWPLLDSPVPMLAATAFYLFIVWKGPKWMSKRKPFDLKALLVLYNLALVVLSVYMFWEFFASTFLNKKFSLVCQPVDYSNDKQAVRLASVIWWYYFSKIIEFMDTFFFILRKKQSQVTFLHVYHHSTMVILWYIGAKWVPGGESYFSATINSFIHILMYSYYLLSAFGPTFQKYLWWKKYMTSLQLAQFVAIICHTTYAIHSDCGYPKQYQIALILYAFSHVLLFGNFYYHSYVKRAGGRKSRKSSEPVKSESGRNGSVKSGKVEAQATKNGISTLARNAILKRQSGKSKKNNRK